jgi:DNA-binding NtrC family response regulator
MKFKLNVAQYQDKLAKYMGKLPPDLSIIIRARSEHFMANYRINVVPLEIPPLRERRDDIPLLIDHFLKKFVPDRIIKITPEALAILINHPWLGNVRELRNVIQRVSLFCTDKIKLSDLPSEFHKESPLIQIIKACSLCFSNNKFNFSQIVQCVESNLIREALKETNGNQSEAAKKLGLSLSTFRDKMRKYAKTFIDK